MEMSFDFIGDSHLARLVEAGVRFPVSGKLRYWTRRGGRIDFLARAVNDILGYEGERASVADVTVIFIGGNDIDASNVNIRAVATQFVSACNRLVQAGSMVFVCEQWPRPGARYGLINYQTNLEFFEHLVETGLDQGAWLWHWDKSLKFSDSFFGRDGVHCASYKCKKVARYFCAAAVAAARKLNWRLYY